MANETFLVIRIDNGWAMEVITICETLDDAQEVQAGVFAMATRAGDFVRVVIVPLAGQIVSEA